VQGVRCKDQGPRTKNRGLLRQIRMDQARKADLRGPEPSAARLGPRAFCTDEVDSLGEGFVWINPLDLTALKKLEYGGDFQ
jgi:hypothetical protein